MCVCGCIWIFVRVYMYKYVCVYMDICTCIRVYDMNVYTWVYACILDWCSVLLCLTCGHTFTHRHHTPWGCVPGVLGSAQVKQRWPVSPRLGGEPCRAVSHPQREKGCKMWQWQVKTCWEEVTVSRDGTQLHWFGWSGLTLDSNKQTDLKDNRSWHAQRLSCIRW